MKAQSAIEYLTTYGWMLVVVAIIGGAIYPLIGDQCLQEPTGFQSEPLTVEDYAFTAGNNVSLELRNVRSRELEIEEVVASVNDRERTYQVSENISSGQQEVTSLPAFEESESCEQVELEVVYSIGSLDGLRTSGEVVGQFSFNNQSLPQPLDAVNVNY